MPAVRRLFLIMKTGTEEYFGITTGRVTPGLVNTNLVAFHTDALEAVSLKDSFEDLVWDRAKLWHAPKGAAWKLAG